MNDKDRVVAALRWFFSLALGCVWVIVLSNKLDKIIKLLEGK